MSNDIFGFKALAKKQKKANKSISKKFKDSNKKTAKQLKANSKAMDKLFKKFLKQKINADLSKERKAISLKIKNEVHKKYKGKCNKCPKRNPLDIHHKNFKNSDNKLSNLVLLCKNCHGLEHEKKFKKVFATEFRKKNKLK